MQNVKILSRDENGAAACTVSFIDIRSAAKAHNAENKVDEWLLKTDYYEPPSSAAVSAYGSGGTAVGSGSDGSGGGTHNRSKGGQNAPTCGSQSPFATAGTTSRGSVAGVEPPTSNVRTTGTRYNTSAHDSSDRAYGGYGAYSAERAADFGRRVSQGSTASGAYHEDETSTTSFRARTHFRRSAAMDEDKDSPASNATNQAIASTGGNSAPSRRSRAAARRSKHHSGSESSSRSSSGASSKGRSSSSGSSHRSISPSQKSQSPT